MPTFRSILCAVDFSEESRNALRWAAALAGAARGRLRVLNVVDPLLAGAAQARYGIDLARSETDPALRDFVSATLPESAVWLLPPSVEVAVGDASAAILAAADSDPVDLIVMGTQGLGGVRKFLLGSTTERVLRHTPVPVLAVPAGTASIELEAAGPRLASAAILVATDFSPAAREAGRLGTQLAQQFDVGLVIVHVVPAVVAPAQWRSYGSVAEHERVEQARERLAEWSKELPAAVRATPVVAVDRPADAIASAAAAHGAGLIVMGLSGERGLFEPRPGSIAYRVLSAAQIPVLVAPGTRDQAAAGN